MSNFGKVVTTAAAFLVLSYLKCRKGVVVVVIQVSFTTLLNVNVHLKRVNEVNRVP